MDVDEIREFVELTSSYRFYLSKRANPQTVSVKFNRKTKTVQIPSMTFDELFSAETECFMVHENILYHNDVRTIESNSAIEICHTRKSRSFVYFSLKLWLSGDYDVEEEDLLT